MRFLELLFVIGWPAVSLRYSGKRSLIIFYSCKIPLFSFISFVSLVCIDDPN